MPSRERKYEISGSSKIRPETIIVIKKRDRYLLTSGILRINPEPEVAAKSKSIGSMTKYANAIPQKKLNTVNIDIVVTCLRS